MTHPACRSTSPVRASCGSRCAAVPSRPLEGTSSYDGPTDFDPGFATLVDLVEGGDFEAQSTWYLGLSREACVRVIRLTDDGAPRLVIDVEH